jgi:hypothetical protein
MSAIVSDKPACHFTAIPDSARIARFPHDSVVVSNLATIRGEYEIALRDRQPLAENFAALESMSATEKGNRQLRLKHNARALRLYSKFFGGKIMEHQNYVAEGYRSVLRRLPVNYEVDKRNVKPLRHVLPVSILVTL